MKFINPTEFFKYIIENEKAGIDLINDNQRLYSFALDLLDKNEPSFNLLKIAIDNNVYKELLKSFNDDSNTRLLRIEKAIKILTDKCFIDKEKAIWVVGLFSNSIYPTEWTVFQSKYNIASEDKSVSSKEIIKDNNQNFEETNINNIHLNTDSDKKVKRAMLSLEVGDFEKADGFAEDALDLDPENPNAYLVKLLVECKIQKLEDLAILPKPFDSSNNFKMVIRFADKNLKDRMNGYVEERRKYLIYKEAVRNISDTLIDSNLNAINLFKTIADYNDSKDRIKECERNIQQIQYNKAISLMSNIDVLSQNKAIGIFKAILGFKDAEDKIKKCENNISQIHYDEACKLMNSNSVEANRKAINIFDSIINFKDSKDKIQLCETNIKLLPTYNEACGLMNSLSAESNRNAIKIFESIIDFKDSRDKILECETNINRIPYNEACNLISKTSIDSNQSAIKIFESIIDFEDSRQKIEGCNKLIFSIKEKEKEKEQRLKIYNEIINNMVECPAGEFLMGSPEEKVKSEGFLGLFREVEEGELGRFNEEIQHKVILTKSFKISKYPVTQKEYEAVMGNNPSKFRGENRPVECVGWNDAKEFIDRLNSTYRNLIPNGYKFDLPTEAQWEYACRAGTTTSLNSGKNITSNGSCYNLDEVGWYSNNSDGYTHEVGQKKPNAWGIYDMHGNVWEWCRDWYGDYPSASVTDPTGPNGGSNRVLRGGSWFSDARDCRSADRINYYPGSRSNELGFRLALVPVEKG